MPTCRIRRTAPSGARLGQLGILDAAFVVDYTPQP
jgi:hypothetical protein